MRKTDISREPEKSRNVVASGHGLPTAGREIKADTASNELELKLQKSTSPVPDPLNDKRPVHAQNTPPEPHDDGKSGDHGVSPQNGIKAPRSESFDADSKNSASGNLNSHEPQSGSCQDQVDDSMPVRVKTLSEISRESTSTPENDLSLLEDISEVDEKRLSPSENAPFESGQHPMAIVTHPSHDEKPTVGVKSNVDTPADDIKDSVPSSNEEKSTSVSGLGDLSFADNGNAPVGEKKPLPVNDNHALLQNEKERASSGVPLSQNGEHAAMAQSSDEKKSIGGVGSRAHEPTDDVKEPVPNDNDQHGHHARGEPPHNQPPNRRRGSGMCCRDALCILSSFY